MTALARQRGLPNTFRACFFFFLPSAFSDCNTVPEHARATLVELLPQRPVSNVFAEEKALCTLHFARSSHEDYGPFRTRDNGGCYELINVRGRVKLYKIMSC